MSANLETNLFTPQKQSWGGVDHLDCCKYFYSCPCCNCPGVKCSAPCCPSCPPCARPACLTRCHAPFIPTRFCCPCRKPPPCSPPRFCRWRSCCGGGCGTCQCCECGMGVGCGCRSVGCSCSDCRCSSANTCYCPKACYYGPSFKWYKTGRLYEY
ncbi:unnamed protein product [Allacma fusca]|uniref:Uncharacterized protein n=1 Tax=Allacma fusca TaxID=39272 RepID=A0A8J2KQQ9_9HEXA|nr:unnamed protein product [Allacma fusca]